MGNAKLELIKLQMNWLLDKSEAKIERESKVSCY